MLVVEVECDCGDDDSAVAEGEADIGEEMRLLEFERGEVVGEGVVGGVFQVWEGGAQG